MIEESPVKVSESPIIDSKPEATVSQQQPSRPAFGAPKQSIGLTSFLNQKAPPVAAANTEGGEQAESSVAKALNWKNKVEELRRKKQMQEQEKANAVAAASASEGQSTPTDPIKEEQKEEIQQMFAPAPGLPSQSKPTINPSDVIKAQSKFQPLNKLQQEAQAKKAPETEHPVLQTEQPQVEEKKKVTAPAAASKLGATTTSQKVTPATVGANPVTKLPVKPAANNATKANDEKNEKLLKLKQDKEKRETTKAAEATTKVTPPAPTSAAPTTGATKIAQVKPALKKDEEAKTTTAPTGTTKVAPSLGSSAQSAALKKQLGATATASDGAKAPDTKTTNLRPTTARGKEETKDTGASATSLPSARKVLGTSKIAAPTQASKLGTKTLTKPQDNIPEVDHDGNDEESLLDSPPTKLSAMPIAATFEPTEAQLLHFMQTTGLSSGVSAEEHRQVTDELRKKKEEVFALQHEVKDLASRLQNVQQEAATQQDLLKTEMEIKIMEIEQRFAAAQQAAQEGLSQEQKEAAAAQAAQAAQAAENAAQKVAAGYQQQIASYHAQIEQHSAERQKMMEETQEMQKVLQVQSDQQREKFQAEIAFLKSRISDSENRYSDLNKLYSESELAKSQLQDEVESKQADLEIIQLQLDALKDEKDELLNQMQLMSQVSQEDALAGLSEDELKSQNQKLRQAISTLTLNFEVEKQRFASALAEAQKKARLVEEYEKKLEEMDFLLEEVENKEQERAEMEARLDECLEFEKMVEEMAEEIIRKEDENELLQEKIKEIEETLAMQEEISENLEEQIRDMNEELGNKDAKISEMDVERAKLEEMILDENQLNQKYKDRLTDFQQQYKLLQEQLQAAYAVGDQKFKITSLLEKQNTLLQKVREAGKKESETVLGKLIFWQHKLRQQAVEAIIPKRLTEQVQLEALERIQMLNVTKGQALVLVRELCERQFANISALQEEKADQVLLAKFFLKIGNLSITYIDLASKITYWLSKMPVAHYIDCMQKLHSWSKLTFLTTFFEKILSLLKEEARLLNFDLVPFESSVKAVQELESQISLKYSDKRENEENMEMSRKREQEVKLTENNKVRLRNQILKMALAVTAISCPQISGSLIQHTEESSQKCKVVYWKLINVLFQVDMIDTNSTGADYLNLQDLGTDTRLENKYSVISNAMWVSPETAHQDKRDWISVLEAVERDLVSLTNDYKYRKLAQAIEAQYTDGKVQSLDDMYTRGWDVRGPWNTIIEGISKDIEEVEMIKEKVIKMQERAQQMTKEYNQLKKERDEQIVIKQTLEARLTENIVKAEQVPTLLLDIKRMQEREQVLQEQMGQAKIDIEAMREKERELYKKIEEIQQQAQVAIQQATTAALAQGSKRGARAHAHVPPAPVPVPVAQTPSSGATTVAQTPSSGHQSKSSKTTEFFKQMQSMQSNRGSFAGRGSLVTPSNQSQQMNKVDSVELQRQLQFSEDSYNSVIIELQKDRMAMKGQQFMERLRKLDGNNGHMAQYMAVQKDKQETLKKYTKQEQNMLENAVGAVEGLKTRVKREMAAVKIVDLTKVDISTILPLVPINQQEQQKGGSKEEALDSLKLKEKINYMIVKAKDQANDAFNFLFAKESSLHKVKDLSDAVTVEIVSDDLTTSEEAPKVNILPTFHQHQEKINLASIRVQGLPKLKKVINLTDSNLREFKQNLSVFAH